MNMLKVDVNTLLKGVFVIQLDGPIDTYTHETFSYYLEQILEPSTKHIILDMQKVNYISSMGIGVIFRIRKFSNQHKVKFKMAGLQPPVRKILDTVQAMPAQDIFNDRQEMESYLSELQK